MSKPQSAFLLKKELRGLCSVRALLLLTRSLRAIFLRLGTKQRTSHMLNLKLLWKKLLGTIAGMKFNLILCNHFNMMSNAYSCPDVILRLKVRLKDLFCKSFV